MSRNAQKRQMQHVGGILEKKFSHPRFREALTFGKIKEIGERLFREKGIPAKIVEFDFNTHVLRIQTAHPSASRELLGYHEKLNALLKGEGLPAVIRLRTHAISAR